MLNFNFPLGDLERITCLTPGRYTMREAGPRGRNFDLDIQEYHVNADLDDAIRVINYIISKLNAWLAGPRRHGSVRRLDGLMRRTKSQPGFLKEYKGSGRLTRNLAVLGEATLAIGYKIEGRKIPQSDLVRRMAREIQWVRELTFYIERRMNTDIDPRSYREEKIELRTQIEDVKNKVDLAENHRQRVCRDEEISDEPIAKCLYPNGTDLVGSRELDVWNDYDAWQEKGTCLRYLLCHSRETVPTQECFAESLLRIHISKLTPKAN